MKFLFLPTWLPSSKVSCDLNPSILKILKTKLKETLTQEKLISIVMDGKVTEGTCILLLPKWANYSV